MNAMVQPCTDYRTDHERLADAFRSLRATHVTVLGRFCCSSCMWADAGHRAEASGKGLIGFNRQSWRSFDSDKEAITSTLYLQHTPAVAPIAVDALKAEGLHVHWSGLPGKCIAVRSASVTTCDDCAN